MKAVISGKSGFIGTHLSSALLSKGYQVVGIPRELLFSPNDLREFFKREQPDYIFHLAAYGNMSTQKDIPMTVFSNIIGTFNILHESKDIPYRAFINFGSSSEYGKKERAMAEDDPLWPETFYGASKASGTHLAYAFSKQFDKPIITIRPFSVYGPGEADFRFIPTVIRSMIKGTVFQLDGKANHDWIYIDDFMEGTLLVTENIRKISGGVINIGTGKMNSNREVCEILKRISGLKYLMTNYERMRNNDSEVWMSDNTKISSLGFYPKHMLSEGLRKTFDYYYGRYK